MRVDNQDISAQQTATQEIQNPDSNYESPYSLRQIKKQDELLKQSQPKPTKERQTMKQFLNLLNNKDPMSMSLSQSRHDKTLRFSQPFSARGSQSINHFASTSGNFSTSRWVEHNQNPEPSPYQQLLESQRPRRSELSPNSSSHVNENESKHKIEAVTHKLIEEEGFTQQDVQTINQNMIFFKSVAEVKKRQLEQKEKMKPQNFKKTHSKITANFKNRNQAGTKHSQSKHGVHNDLNSKQNKIVNYFSDDDQNTRGYRHGNLGKTGKVMMGKTKAEPHQKVIEIEEIIDQRENIHRKIQQQQRSYQQKLETTSNLDQAQKRDSLSSNPFNQAQENQIQTQNSQENVAQSRQSQNQCDEVEADSQQQLYTDYKPSNLTYKVESERNTQGTAYVSATENIGGILTYQDLQDSQVNKAEQVKEIDQSEMRSISKQSSTLNKQSSQVSKQSSQMYPIQQDQEDEVEQPRTLPLTISEIQTSPSQTQMKSIRSSIPRMNYDSAQRSPPRMNQMSQLQIGMQSPTRPHHQEATEAYLSKFRQDPDEQVQSPERQKAMQAASKKASLTNSVYGIRQTNWKKDLRPLKETKQSFITNRKTSTVNDETNSQQNSQNNQLISQQHDMEGQQQFSYDGQNQTLNARVDSQQYETDLVLYKEQSSPRLNINNQESLNNDDYFNGNNTHKSGSKQSQTQSQKQNSQQNQQLKDGEDIDDSLHTDQDFEQIEKSLKQTPTQGDSQEQEISKQPSQREKMQAKYQQSKSGVSQNSSSIQADQQDDLSVQNDSHNNNEHHTVKGTSSQKNSSSASKMKLHSKQDSITNSATSSIHGHSHKSNKDRLSCLTCKIISQRQNQAQLKEKAL